MYIFVHKLIVIKLGKKHFKRMIQDSIVNFAQQDSKLALTINIENKSTATACACRICMFGAHTSAQQFLVAKHTHTCTHAHARSHTYTHTHSLSFLP